MLTPGDRIDLARRRKGMSKTQLAEALGIKQQSISDLIAGKFPGTSRFTEIAAVLDVPVEWITTGHPRQPWDSDRDSGAAGASPAADQAPTILTEQNLAAVLLEQQRQISALLVEQRERDALTRRQAMEIAALEADIAQLRAERDRIEAAASDRTGKQRPRRKTTGV